jgi:hypothetical protein
MRRVNLVAVVDSPGVILVLGLLGEAAHIVDVDRAIVGACHQELVVLGLQDLLTVVLRKSCHGLELPEFCNDLALMHLAGLSWHLQVGHVFLGVLWRALDHNELDLVDLMRVIICYSFNNLAFLQIPNN